MNKPSVKRVFILVPLLLLSPMIVMEFAQKNQAPRRWGMDSIFTCSLVEKASSVEVPESAMELASFAGRTANHQLLGEQYTSKLYLSDEARLSTILKPGAADLYQVKCVTTARGFMDFTTRELVFPL